MTAVSVVCWVLIFFYLSFSSPTYCEVMSNEFVPPVDFVDMLGDENFSGDEESGDKDPVSASKGKLLPTRQSGRIVPVKPLVGSYEFVHDKSIAAEAKRLNAETSLANNVAIDITNVEIASSNANSLESPVDEVPLVSMPLNEFPEDHSFSMSLHATLETSQFPPFSSSDSSSSILPPITVLAQADSNAESAASVAQSTSAITSSLDVTKPPSPIAPDDGKSSSMAGDPTMNLGIFLRKCTERTEQLAIDFAHSLRVASAQNVRVPLITK